MHITICILNEKRNKVPKKAYLDNFFFNCREEYIKLQKRLSDVEKQNSILLNSSKNSESNISFENNKTFIGRILDTVANLVNQEKYR